MSNVQDIQKKAADAEVRRSFLASPTVRQYGGIIISLAVLCVVFSVMSPRFLAFNNFMNIMQQVAVIAVAAYGMTYVILLGDIDLSIGSIIAVAGMVAAQAFAMGFGFVPAVALTLAAGALMGALNGALSAKLMLPSFIVTVATMGIYRGMVSLPTNGAPAMIENDTWLAIGGESFLGIPIIIWIMAVLFVVNHIILSKTIFGRQVYLTGGNREAAIYSGIRVDRIKIIVFTISGMMAAISGMLLSSRLSSAQTNAGTGYELDAIAAVVLGGTSLAGGVGTIVGTILGALIIGVINNGMNMLSVPYFYQLIVKGAVILIAVWLDVRSKSART
ncbi:MAG: ribose ABC transporter permease [Aquamicrobium sp.]|uniref:ABC transporter permease n=1 Tax=Mesorhizobium sp. Pch-S TaxID=2082387 RepID=UPI0010134518|nr:ribose ABC transporter permease [Mesorhizobium sp. Pch-S]MBR2686604.1 ribose ABC transporter permease [Aquamicrobium sp.]QAZ42638.1 ribose ABC transporter permease [Mesorhizobium sp. Pch-S]